MGAGYLDATVKLWRMLGNGCSFINRMNVKALI